MTLPRDAGYRRRRGKTNRPTARETFAYKRRSRERARRRVPGYLSRQISLRPRQRRRPRDPIPVALIYRMQWSLFSSVKSKPLHLPESFTRYVDSSGRRARAGASFSNLLSQILLILDAIFVHCKSRSGWHDSFTGMCSQFVSGCKFLKRKNSYFKYLVTERRKQTVA